MKRFLTCILFAAAATLAGCSSPEPAAKTAEAPAKADRASAVFAAGSGELQPASVAAALRMSPVRSRFMISV